MARNNKASEKVKTQKTWRFICTAKQVLGGAELGNYYQGQIVTLEDPPSNAKNRKRLTFLLNNPSFEQQSFDKPATVVQAEPDELSSDPDQLGPVNQLQIPTDLVELLQQNGYGRIGQLVGMSLEQLAELPGMDKDGAGLLRDAITEFVNEISDADK